MLADDAFAALVLARIIEPTSKADTVRAGGDHAAAASNTLHTAPKQSAAAANAICWPGLPGVLGPDGTKAAALIMYDVTTLHFENEAEDDLRRVGMSK